MKISTYIIVFIVMFTVMILTSLNTVTDIVISIAAFTVITAIVYNSIVPTSKE